MPVDERTNAPTGAHARGGRRRAFILLTSGILLLLVIAWWLQIPWTWSPVDDAGHVNAITELIRTQGFISAFLNYSDRQFRGDLDWGLFRPSYWAYPSLVYFLSPEWARVVRLVMVLVAVGGPLLYFHRRGLRGPQFIFAAALLLAAGSSLYIGLYLTSLQELSGAALIGLGLAVRNRWLRLVAWTLAAWFKAPFAWLLIGQSIVDWRRGRRALAVSNAGIGILTLALAVVMARSGSYTGGYRFDPFKIWHNLGVLLEPMNALLLVALVWWLLVTKTRLNLGLSSIGFLVGWLGYTAQLLPWYVSAYYMGPISYLFGLFLISTLPIKTARPTPGRSVIGLAVPITIAAILIATPLMLVFQLQHAMRTFQDCLITRPGTTSALQGTLVYLTSSPEGPIRLEQNLRLVDPDWTGTIALRDDVDSPVDLILNVGPPLIESDPPLLLECAGPNAQVYRTSSLPDKAITP